MSVVRFGSDAPWEAVVGYSRVVVHGDFTKLIASGGRSAGLVEADLIHAVTSQAGLDGEAVRNVRVLERFALLEVPAAEATRVAGAVDGTAVRGHTLRIEPAKA